MDRLATQALNRAFLASRPAIWRATAGPASTPAEVELRQREQDAIADWRSAVAKCRAMGEPDDC